MGGPLGTRLKYDYNFDIEKNISIIDLIGMKEGRDALSDIYCGDIKAAKKYYFPIIINAATFRASKNHLTHFGLDKLSDIKRVNIACIDFVKSIQDDFSCLKSPIYISAPLGSMNDAYYVDSQLTVEKAKNYHQDQMNVFKESKIDYVHAVTISSISEAMGIACAAQECGIEYTIGFILNEHGHLLDGTPLSKAINIIDESIKHKSIGYFITCTHASVILKLKDLYPEYNRIIGIQVNGSNLPSVALTNMSKNISDTPEKIAKDILSIKKQLNIKIIGGCCGTSVEHLMEMARFYSASFVSS
jgi:S-methylmethionine-dependent homocysteine/selenocysteine methylase